jgi:hypothetical protein
MGKALLEQLLQRFPGLAAHIIGWMDEDSTKGLRACSRTCRAAVTKMMKRAELYHSLDVKVDLQLVQTPRWQHLQELRLW